MDDLGTADGQRNALAQVEERLMSSVIDGEEVAEHLDDLERRLWRLPPSTDIGTTLRRLARLREALPDIVRLRPANPYATLQELVETSRAGLQSVAELEDWYETLGARNPQEVRAWRAASAGRPETAAAWAELGVQSPQTLAELAGLAMTLDQAAQWGESGIPIPELLNWRRAGVGNPSELAEWRAIGVTEPAEVMDWRKVAADAAQVTAWRAAGVSEPAVALDWFRAGARSPETVRRWFGVGVRSAKELTDWRRAGARTVDAVRRWTDAGFTAGTMRTWRGFSLQDVETLRSLGLGPMTKRFSASLETALPWLTAGLPVSKVDEFVEAFGGRPPESLTPARDVPELLEWAAAGLLGWAGEDCEIADAKRWTGLGLLPGENKWLPHGAVLVALRRRSPAAETSVEALVAAEGGYRLIRNGRSAPLSAASALAALRSTHGFRTALPGEETRFVRPGTSAAPDWIDDDDLLDAIRYASGADDTDAIELWDDALPAWPEEDEDCEPWRGFRRVFLDGRPLMPLLAAGRWTASWLTSWTELVVSCSLVDARWDSSSYAGVGNAGTGRDALIRVRRRLFLTLTIEDSAVLDWGCYRSHRSDRAEVLRYLTQVGLERDFRAEYPHLAPPLPEDPELPPDSEFSCDLPERDLAWIASRLRH